MIIDAIVNRPEAFEPKDRWAMDWYYPVLSGAMDVSAGKARLADGWATFVMDGLGVALRRATSRGSPRRRRPRRRIAFAAIGDFATATDLLRWTRDAPPRRRFVLDRASCTPTASCSRSSEHTSYTAAAVILAADAITGAGPAAHVFTAAELFD